MKTEASGKERRGFNIKDLNFTEKEGFSDKRKGSDLISIDEYPPDDGPPRKLHMEIPKIGFGPAITNIYERLEEDSSYRNTTSRGNVESHRLKETNVTDLKIQIMLGDKSATKGHGQKISISGQEKQKHRLESTPDGRNLEVRMSTGVQYPICMSEVVSKNNSTPKRDVFLVGTPGSILGTPGLLKESPGGDMQGISTVEISEISDRGNKSKVTKNIAGADSVINKLGIEG